MDNLKKKLILLSIFLILVIVLSSCNLYNWVYSAESSEEFDIVMAEANSEFFDKNYDKALVLYDKALAIQSNLSITLSSEALYGRIQSRILKQTDSKSVLTYYYFLFTNNTDSQNSLFNSFDSFFLGQLYEDMTFSYQDVLLILSSDSDNAINPGNFSFLSDSGFIAAMAGCLRLLDSNTNSIPGENTDPIVIKNNFSLAYSNLTPQEGTNSLLSIQEATNLLHSGTNFYHQLFLLYPNLDTPGSVFQNILKNINTLISNSEIAYTNIEAGL